MKCQESKQACNDGQVWLSQVTVQIKGISNFCKSWRKEESTTCTERTSPNSTDLLHSPLEGQTYQHSSLQKARMQIVSFTILVLFSLQSFGSKQASLNYGGDQNLCSQKSIVVPAEQNPRNEDKVTTAVTRTSLQLCLSRQLCDFTPKQTKDGIFSWDRTSQYQGQRYSCP